MKSYLKKIIYNTFSNYILKGGMFIVNLLTIPLFIKYVGGDAFGIIIFSSSLIGYTLYFDLGLNTGIIKFTSQFYANNDLEKINSLLNSTIKIFFIIGILFFSGISVVANTSLINIFNIAESEIGSFKKILLITGFISLIAWPQFVLDGILKGFQKYDIQNIITLSSRIVSVSSALLVAVLSFPLEVIFIFFNLDKLLVLVIEYFYIIKNYPWINLFRVNFDIKILRETFTFNKWIMINQIAVFFEYSIAYFLLITLLSPASVTNLMIILYLFRLIQTISGLASSAIMPAISEINEREGENSIRKILIYAVRYHNLLFTPIVLAVFYICHPFINLWVGQNYLRYEWLIIVTILFQLLWQSNSMLGQIYTGIGLAKKTAILAIISSFLNFTTSLLLIKALGEIGVVIGILIGGLFTIPLVYRYIIPDFGLKPLFYLRHAILKTQIPLIIFGALLFPLKKMIDSINSWIELISVFLIILTLCYLVGIIFCVEKNHFMLVKNKLKLIFN